MQQPAAQSAGLRLLRIKGVQQKITPLKPDYQRNRQRNQRRLYNIAGGNTQHVAKQNMIEMDLRLNRHVQHQARAKHPGKDDAHDGITLNAAVIVEITGGDGAEQPGDKRADGEGDTEDIRYHHARKNRVAHGIAHQRPALEHQKHRQQRAGDGNDRRRQHGVDHKGKLERFKQRAQHEASLARRRLASRPCFGAKTKAAKNSSVWATTIIPPVAPSR